MKLTERIMRKLAHYFIVCTFDIRFLNKIGYWDYIENQKKKSLGD